MGNLNLLEQKYANRVKVQDMHVLYASQSLSSLQFLKWYWKWIYCIFMDTRP